MSEAWHHWMGFETKRYENESSPVSYSSNCSSIMRQDDRSAVEPIKPGDEYLFFDAEGKVRITFLLAIPAHIITGLRHSIVSTLQPLPLVCKLKACRCIRCVCTPVLPPNFELELAGLNGCSTLDDFGEAVEAAINKVRLWPNTEPSALHFPR